MQGNTLLAGLPQYFGDFGGILVPDAFTPDIFTMATEAEIVLNSKEFMPCFKAILTEIPSMKIRHVERDGRHIQIVCSQALYYMVAGHLALSKLRKCKFNFIGCEDADIALFAAKVCQKAEMHCHITLGKTLSNNKKLKEELQSWGVELDDSTCAKLYDRPQAYAFQKYLGNRSDSCFIPVGANLGCYPYPALSGFFGGIWGEKLKDAVEAAPDVVVATMLHGNSAVAAFRAFGTSCLATVEQPICQQYHGEFCGCSMLMVRTAAYREFSVTLAPELTDMWRMARVLRLGAEDYCRGSECDGLSVATNRAIEIVSRRLPETRSLLIVEGENE